MLRQKDALPPAWQCPFCPNIFETAGDRKRHATKHNADMGGCIQMRLDGEILAISHSSYRGSLYKCPFPACNNQGTPVDIWNHYSIQHRLYYQAVPSNDVTLASLSETETEIDPSSDFLKDLLLRETATNLYTFVAAQLKRFIPICPVEGIIASRLPSDHQKLEDCPWSFTSTPGSEFRSFFKTLEPPKISCSRCWSPKTKPEIFHFEDGRCTDDRREWRNWWKTLPYLIYSSPYLRSMIFAFLKIPPGAFRNLGHYCRWLSKSASNISEFSNLHLVHYAYWKLYAGNCLTRPYDIYDSLGHIENP